MKCDWIIPPGAGLGLQIDALVKRFGSRTVLDGIDLDVAPGEFVAIVGRSGGGKSTLLRLLAGLESATAGTVRSGGEALAERREDIRLMFQEARLLPWRSVVRNVALGLPQEEGEARALAALAQVGLAERAGDWPSILSGGQRQRVALARALVHRPRLMLLDEPLGALDALTRIEMQRLIESVWQRSKFTAVLVTHDVAEAIALADRVLLIEDGHISLDERVDLPRPRSHGSSAFAAMQERILSRVLGQPADGQTAEGESADVIARQSLEASNTRWRIAI